MAQTGGCEQFRVGTQAWTDCIQDQATGGGLMPWIVVIPLAIMVVGMMIGFARQFSAAGQRRARAHGASGTAGTWLIFVSLIELAIGTGSWIGDRRAPGEGGGYAISGVILLGVGFLLLVIGVFLKIKGRRRARVFHSGVPGEAVIRAVHETGTMVNNQPMYAFDLDVTGQGLAPVSTRHREVVPFWFLSRVGPQSRVPVKVDPQNPTRVIFDWEAFAAMPAQPGVASPAAPAEAATGFAPMADTLADAMQTARALTDHRPNWSAGKAVGLVIVLFVLAIVGGGLYFVTKIFGQVSDVTTAVTDQVSDALDAADGAIDGGAAGNAGDTTIEVSRRAEGGEPVGFEITLPAGWVDVTAAVEERQGAVLVDVVMKPQTPSDARIVVTRSVRYLDDPARASEDIRSVRAGLEREFGDSLTRSRLVRLAGETALELEIAAGADGLRSRQVAVMRGGQVLLVNLTASQSDWRGMLSVFDDVLESWQWGPVSA